MTNPLNVLIINDARHDPLSFYALASISFLESTVPVYVNNLAGMFADDPMVLTWLKTVWQPEESAHGSRSRAYVESTWPEFDWTAAYRHFLSVYRPEHAQDSLQATPALEALARCVTETETTMIYRCLASYTHDTELRALLCDMSADEVSHYRYFRDVFERYNRSERNAWWRKAATIVQRSQLVRDKDLASAFAPLNVHWEAPAPFKPQDFNRFLVSAGRVMQQHFPFAQARKMLFKPLRNGSRFESLLINGLEWLVKRQYPLSA